MGGGETVECPSQEHHLKSSTFHFTSHSSTPLNFAIVPEGEICVNVVIGKDWYMNGSPPAGMHGCQVTELHPCPVQTSSSLLPRGLSLWNFKHEK